VHGRVAIDAVIRAVLGGLLIMRKVAGAVDPREMGKSLREITDRTARFDQLQVAGSTETTR
jgi:hypothetical protein